MSTLHAIKLGSEVVHNNRSVSTGAFSLKGHDSSYIMSAKKVLLKVHTLGCKSTNMQSTDFHNPAGQQYKSGLLVWRPHDMPLQAVTCRFFVETFIIISHIISQCICSMYHVLTCSGTYIMFVWTSCHTFWYCWHQCIHTCTWAISSSQGIQSLYPGKQKSLTATLFSEHCRNTNQGAHASN